MGLRLEKRLSLLCVTLLAIIALYPFSIPEVYAEPQAATKVETISTSIFGDKSFEEVWARTDKPVQEQKADPERDWFWGEKPLADVFYETQIDAYPYGRKLVLYFDKGRMEISNFGTDEQQVTGGKLVNELITGRIAPGEGETIAEFKPSANLPLMGDDVSINLTYRQLFDVFGKTESTATSPKKGEPITRFWNNLYTEFPSFEKRVEDENTFVAQVEKGFGIPKAFLDFFSSEGSIYKDNKFSKNKLYDGRSFIGQPVTEAYWVQTQINGVAQPLLFQAYEQRILVYNPASSENKRVVFTDTGKQYIKWRYNNKLPDYSKPLIGIFDMPNAPVWYEINTNTTKIRTKPNSTAPVPAGVNRPYVVNLYKGDNIQVIRSVRGEEVVKGNNLWYQVYEKPDLFVYSGYARRFAIPNFPQPTKTHSGFWVAVSLDKQMMAVFNNNEVIYRTFIAGGVPKFATITGSFTIEGSYRPVSQPMEGGNRAANDYYRLEDVRMVNYFYKDFAIHGSYWHAKYGIDPQSHGCVNATVYDAGLIHQLPAGTPVEVFYAVKNAPAAKLAKPRALDDHRWNLAD